MAVEVNSSRPSAKIGQFQIPAKNFPEIEIGSYFQNWNKISNCFTQFLFSLYKSHWDAFWNLENKHFSVLKY